MAGKVNKAIGGSKGFHYKPVSSEDLTLAVETALSKTDQVKGQRFSVSGADSLTMNDLLHHLERSVGKEEGSTKLNANLGISDLVEEFFTGIAHDKNMARFAEFMDKNSPNLEEGNADFFR